jgi:hypothetical protein
MKKLPKILLILLPLLLLVPLGVLGYPTEFPHGVTIHQEQRTYEGFTLYAPLGGGTGLDGTNEVYLIDMKGNVVHIWTVEHAPGLYGFLLPNGNLLYGGNTRELQPTPGGGGGGTIQEIDWDGNVVWEYTGTEISKYMHHDFDKLPNGNILVLVWEEMRPENIDRVKGGIDGTEFEDPDTGEKKIWSDAIYEIDYETKEIVWEWHAEDELVIENYPLGPLNNRHEWTHGNSVVYLPEGNSFNGKPAVMTMFRQPDVVMIIDYATKEVLWEWGPGEIKVPHDPTLLDNGNILLFDNGMQKPDTMRSGIPASRVLEVNPNTNEIEWEYTGDGLRNFRFFSGVISGAQRLPNGNTLICEGVPGRIFEVTRGEKIEYDEDTPDAMRNQLFDNEIVWEYHNPHYASNMVENAVFRAYRYGVNDINWPVDMPDPNPQEITKEADETEGVSIFDQENRILLLVGGVAGLSVLLNIYLLLSKKKNDR